MITVQYGQTLMDIAIERYGSASSLIELANDNGLSPSDEITAGTQLLIRDAKPDSAITLFSDYLNQNGIVVMSRQTAEETSVLATNDDDLLTDNDNNGIHV